MSSMKDPPSYPEKSVIVLFGKRVQFKNAIGKMILGNDSAFDEVSNSFVVETNQTFKIVNTPDFFEENCPHLDQMIIDCMAHSLPGPKLFILAIDSENSQEEKVIAQINKLQETFGENITEHLLIMVQDIESFYSLKENFVKWLAIADQKLASTCKNCCSASFQYDYKNYSEDVVMRRKTDLEKRRDDGYPLHDRRVDANSVTPSNSREYFPAPAPEDHIGKGACDVSDDIFNIVLMGPCGTGKSASANTILTDGNAKLDSRQLFRSEASSMPITKQCEVRIVGKPFGTKVRLVDTPDFFHDQLEASQAQVDECKRFCQPGRCVVLLVFQLGRFTDGEGEILQKLEDKFGWKIRDSTIILLTHGEDLRGSLQEFIEANHGLSSLVRLCSHRCHLFQNNSKNSEQVKQLIKIISNQPGIFPMFNKKKKTDCCVL